MMRGDCLLRTSLPEHSWPIVIRPDSMETDRNNDSGISPGRTSSETNSNSPKFANTSPERSVATPAESPRQKSPFYYGKTRPYSPPNFNFSRTPGKLVIDEARSSPEGKNKKMDAVSDNSNGFDTDREYLNDSGEPPTEDSLERLKTALEKSSVLSGIFKSRNNDLDVHEQDNSQDSGKKEFPCPLCAYSTPYRHRYMEHLGTHYSDKCTLCEFTGQNIQDLRQHLQEVHNICDIQDLSDPQDNNSDCQDDDEAPNKRGKSKSFKCKQCNYVTTTKLDFWEHNRGHIKAEKLLTCPKCPFVTEYKHHLEYHLRNHFGSKPFKCGKCSYSCVNKSMLNSHLKSHSNVYQYRCSDCAYATKYCHSLKLHLRKYDHKPAMVLNADGSPNPLPIIDVYGTRRGPKQKSSKAEEQEEKNAFLEIKVPGKDKDAANLPGGIVVPSAPQSSPRSPDVGVYSINNNNNNDIKDAPPQFFYCSICEFHTLSPEVLSQHMFLHAAETNLAHIFKTNNNLHDSGLVKDYFHNVLLGHSLDQTPFVDPRSMSPIGFLSPKPPSPVSRRPASPLDLSKQDNSESPAEVSQDKKKRLQEPEAKKEPSSKHRRKGKAYKLERINERIDERFDASPDEFYNKPEDETFKIKIPEFKVKMETLVKSEEVKSENVKMVEEENVKDGKESYGCPYCDIAFKDVIMYTMHMGYHGYQDPFTCNMCGQITPDKVSFFLHIARSSHS